MDLREVILRVRNGFNWLRDLTVLIPKICFRIVEATLK